MSEDEETTAGVTAIAEATVDALRALKRYLERPQTAEIQEVCESVLGQLEGSLDEELYLKELNPKRRRHVTRDLRRIERLNQSQVPLKFRVVQAKMPIEVKARVVARIDACEEGGGNEAAKTRAWVEQLLRVPFGEYVQLPQISDASAYIDNLSRDLDASVYGHETAKGDIMQLVCQWMSNPLTVPTVLGIQGPPGNGKTTLCRRAIARALGRPFVQVSLGGAQDASFLEGHGFTYEGAIPGRVVGMLMESKCMNPVIFFDELDKLSDTARGDEITGLLTHLTDASQNEHFADKYFDGVTFDLSKALKIFSFNDESKVNRILKDRMRVIRTAGYSLQQKVELAQKFLVPDVCRNVGIEGVTFDDDALSAMVAAVDEEEGVRALQRGIESVVLKLNMARYVHAEEGQVGGGGVLDVVQTMEVKLPYRVTRDVAMDLLDAQRESDTPLGMYV